MKNPKKRLTVDDFDPGWAEVHAGRLADVHGAPAADGHWWRDRDGHPVDSYETGASCGGCGWRPLDDVIGLPLPPVIPPRLH